MSDATTGLITGGVLGFLLGGGAKLGAGGARAERRLGAELDRALAFGNTLEGMSMVVGTRPSLEIASELNAAVPPRAFVLEEGAWYGLSAGGWLPDADLQAGYAGFDYALYLRQLREHRAISAIDTQGRHLL